MNKKILILAPHTDDGELGCGGTITKYCNEGHSVYYAAFSACRQSLAAGFPPDTLEKEVKQATSILGIPPENLFLLDYQVRMFDQRRQEILEDMIKLSRSIQPDIVFVPSPTDIHQDHQVISNEGIRAFKNTSMLGYEMPWNNLSFNTRCFIKLEKQHMNKKVEALKEYESQKYRTYLKEDFILSLAHTRGVQIGCEYAEAFEIIRWIL